MDERQLTCGIQTGQQYVAWPDLLALWQEADRLGYDSGWVFDHFMPIFANPEGPCLECWTTLTALGMNTNNIRLGTLVMGNSYRHPAVLANMAVTLDIVSNGRLELGLGAGWHELEYNAYGIPYPKPSVRIGQLSEAIQVIKLLWTEKTPTFNGKYFQLKEALCEPKPAKPLPTIWVGGAGEQLTLKVVAQHADGWNTFMSPIEEYKHKLDVLEGHCQTVGRDPSTIRKSLAISAVVVEGGADIDAKVKALAAQRRSSVEELKRRLVVGSPEDCAEQLRPYVDLGVDLFILGMRPSGGHNYDYGTLRLFAEQVMPLLRDY